MTDSVDYLNDDKLILLVPQPKTNLISEWKLALFGWKNMTYNRVKAVYDQKWNKVTEAVRQHEANPLYIVDPIYFPVTERENQTIREGPDEVIAFAGMLDQEGQGEHKGEESDWTNEDTRHWHHLDIRRVDHYAHLVHEVLSLVWDDWYTQFNHTLYDHDMTDKVAEF